MATIPRKSKLKRGVAMKNRRPDNVTDGEELVSSPASDDMSDSDHGKETPVIVTKDADVMNGLKCEQPLTPYCKTCKERVATDDDGESGKADIGNVERLQAELNAAKMDVGRLTGENLTLRRELETNTTDVNVFRTKCLLLRREVSDVRLLRLDYNSIIDAMRKQIDDLVKERNELSQLVRTTRSGDDVNLIECLKASLRESVDQNYRERDMLIKKELTIRGLRVELEQERADNDKLTQEVNDLREACQQFHSLGVVDRMEKTP